MHPLIDKQTVKLIRQTGATFANAPDRKEILEQHGLPCDQKAENVIVTGCQILPAMPRVLQALAWVFDRAGFSYTFLSEEYCCGNNLYRPAIKAKDQEALAECQDLSKAFVEQNINKARQLGASRLVIFCSPCYPIYKHAFPDENIVFYPTAIEECLPSLERDMDIDYYAGCYRLHKKFAPVPMDLKGVSKCFSKIKGLGVHSISAPQCCYKPEGAAHMMNSVQTRTMVHVCTGCYFQALMNAPKDEKEPLNILMLPEFIDNILQEAKS
ncbi:hypothetical protein Dalk_0303 [Desulfatibacillum aliphaticivorans]|uniref:Cysteine-rich domain-containing protein n=1 Tax=Desulfatibacillum aliphaticivorans TaxID=218208 RepID=B8F8Y0_DESAL|nr:heterodisulfide reductase-related iron-sulfur binding cluster [Desulfatibacillum aliphaticivorans]ACL02012.1 hypothetical protein Dalk_0303 [Desulfatibacillum aliphaticivorans]